VNAQVDDCRIALRKHCVRYDVDDFFVHGVGWLTAVSTSKLGGVSPWIVGSDAGWLDIVDAAANRARRSTDQKRRATCAQSPRSVKR